MAYIEWDDDDGTGTLVPSYPATTGNPSRRFRTWLPRTVYFGPHRHALGTGQRFQFVHRTDYLATFELPGIRPTQFDLWHRFREHALKGCTFFVVTEDAASRVYECLLAEGVEPELQMEDPSMLEYVMSITVKNIAAARMLCDYTALASV